MDLFNLFDDKELKEIQKRWRGQWPKALSLWNPYTQLTEPRWCFTGAEEKEHGLSDSFAMIRLEDHAVVISLNQVFKHGLEQYGLEILAHEIGHHIYCPADLNDHGRVLARVEAALTARRHLAPMVANLYEDLLINDRLQRSQELDMAGVYLALRGDKETDKLWKLYMRIYEILWRIEKGVLAGVELEQFLEIDAQLGARLVRHYAKHWLDGAGRFATLCLRYILEDEAAQTEQILKPLFDTKDAGVGGMPSGLTAIETGELEGVIHPALDEELTGLGGMEEEEEEEEGTEVRGEAKDKANKEEDKEGALRADIRSSEGNSPGQYPEPFEYGQLLKSLGINIDGEEAAIRYYRERAVPHLIPFPVREVPESSEPQAEGLEVWDVSSPMERIDWFESIVSSPYVVPGLTTVERYYGTTRGSMPERAPIDLDLYVDSSGSMSNPQYQTSYLTLAGAIITLSALRVGARVQATLWSGTNQFISTDGFVTDEHEIFRILVGYFGGSTAFPIHVLRDTYADRPATARPVHVMVISDEGVTTMFDKDEQGNSGWDVAKSALEKAKAGGTLLLKLWNPWRRDRELRRASEEGWSIHRVENWQNLIEFARAFSKEAYTKETSLGK